MEEGPAQEARKGPLLRSPRRLWLNIELGISQYYSILHGQYNITQNYMQYWVAFNSIILKFCIQHYSILLGHYNITQYDIT